MAGLGDQGEKDAGALPAFGMGREYDFIVCGAGSSGSVVAGRLAQNANVSVLLLEAGGSDQVAEVLEPRRWTENLGSERDWGFSSAPNAHLQGRSTRASMGKVLGGGSSINVMLWLQGHQDDWDHIAEVSGDPGWSYDAVRELFRRIEDWGGQPDPGYRGSGGPVHVEPASEPSPLAPALLEAAGTLGISTYSSPNGALMRGDGGCAITDLIIKDGKRRSIYESFVGSAPPSNLTVLPETLVRKVVFAGNRAIGVEVLREGRVFTIRAAEEIILSLGAIQTPKVLMHSGIGDARGLEKFSIPVIQDLPGVGRNLQDHVVFDCVWEYDEHPAPRNNLAEALVLWKSDSSLTRPDLLLAQVEVTRASPELMKRYAPPDKCWGLKVGLLQPESRGRVSITGAAPESAVAIDSGYLSEPGDVETALRAVEVARSIGNASPLSRFAKRELMPAGRLSPEEFVRLGAQSFYHQTCTASMGRGELSVVNAALQVHGMEGLRIADGSVLPRITRANTMAPCVVVGERAADLIRSKHNL